MDTHRKLLHAGMLGLCILLSVITRGCTQPDPPEQLQPLVEAYVHAWNTGDFTRLERVVSGGFEFRMSPRFEPVRGLDSLKILIREWRTAYPDFTITLQELIFATDAVAARWTIRATNSGPGRQPPTGKTVVVPGMSILHITDGMIIDEWVYGNDLSWAEQLGYTLVPAGG